MFYSGKMHKTTSTFFQSFCNFSSRFNPGRGGGLKKRFAVNGGIHFIAAWLSLILFQNGYAQDGGTQPSPIHFGGQEFAFHHVGNTPRALQNFYYPVGQVAEKSTSRIVRSSFPGIGDCLAYVQALGKAAKQRQADVLFKVMPDSNANAALFAQVVSSGGKNIHTLEVWHLVKPDPKFPMIITTQFSLRASGEGSQAKLSNLLNEHLKEWSAELIKGKFPVPFLAFKKESVGDHNVAGGLVKVEGFTMGKRFKVDAVFAKKLGAPNPPPAPFEITIPQKHRKAVVINGAPNVPEIAVFAITDESKKIIESVHYTTFNHKKVEDIVGLLPFFEALIEIQMVIPLVKPKGGQAIDRYRTRINGMDAAVIITGIKNPDGSIFFQKFIALPKPDSEQGVIIIVKVQTGKSQDVKTLADLATKGFAAQVLHSTKFIKGP